MISKKILTLVFCLFYSLGAIAELKQQSLETVTDSEEPFSRRVYSYDFDVSKEGEVHAIYSKPVADSDELAKIVYMSKKVGEVWPAEKDRVVLEAAGKLASVSTKIIYDDIENKVHISYIVYRDFIDGNGDTHDSGLVYQTITNGSLSPKINISSGGFHSLMQIDENGEAIFAREYEDFLNEDGSIRSGRFPKALRIQLPMADNEWTDRSYILSLPVADDYRLANFIYDVSTKRYHVTYGNKDANFLRETYPTTNPPVSKSANAVFFPEGAGHELIYAYSDDLNIWHSSTIDGTGSLSENEFWTDLVVNKGNVYSASYRYKTDAMGIHQGSSAIFGQLTGESWDLLTVAGKTIGASEHRAGMGAKIVIDEAGGFHGVWDNSPDVPIDSESDFGTTMYRYSPDGKNWATRQAILPFSVEGAMRAKLYKNRLLVMFLGDARDARVVFSEFELPTVTANVMEISTDKMFYGAGDAIDFHARLQGNPSINSDLYFVATGPYDKNQADQLIPTLTTAFHYFGADFKWHKIVNLLDAKTVLKGFPLINVNESFNQAIARNSTPFSNPGRYRLYNVATVAGSNLQDFDLLTPLYSYDLHVCNQANCAEIISK